MSRKVDPARQRVVSFDNMLTFRTGSGAARSIDFQVPIPDSRLRVKIAVLFIPTSGTASSGLGGTIWLREADQDASGVSGNLIPATNIEGTLAVPTVFPTAGLQGYSREFISAADFILGTTVFTSGGPSSHGSWVLQTRYQPQAVRFTPQEWDIIAPLCNPSAQYLID